MKSWMLSLRQPSRSDLDRCRMVWILWLVKRSSIGRQATVSFGARLWYDCSSWMILYPQWMPRQEQVLLRPFKESDKEQHDGLSQSLSKASYRWICNDQDSWQEEEPSSLLAQEGWYYEQYQRQQENKIGIFKKRLITRNYPFFPGIFGLSFHLSFITIHWFLSGIYHRYSAKNDLMVLDGLEWGGELGALPWVSSIWLFGCGVHRCRIYRQSGFDPWRQ